MTPLGPAVPVAIFVSHSSKDHELTRAIVDLLTCALTMSQDEIRCTSLPGYKLPAGIPIEEQLRAEVLDSTTLIALVTPNSIRSSYVLFEIGARWGRKLHYFPVFAAGATPHDVNDWLRGINGTDCNDKTDLLALIPVIAKAVGRTAAQPNVYFHHIERVVQASQDSSNGIRITDPRPNDQVDKAFEVRGECKDIPEGVEVWVFTMAGTGRDTRYWPQKRAVVDGTTWQSQVYGLGGKTGDRRKIGCFIVGECGQVLVRYYHTAGRENSKDGIQRWVGINELTSDIIQCDSVEVIVK